MRKILLSALALGAMSSTALAEPVTLTGAEMDGVTAGAEFFAKKIEGDVQESFLKQVAVLKKKDVDILKTIDVEAFAKIRGNIADAEGLAEAFGKNSLSEIQVVTVTTPGTSTSFAEALSATDHFDFHKPRKDP